MVHHNTTQSPIISSCFSAASDGVLVSCTFEREGCIVDFQVVLSGDFNTMGSVFVGEERGGPCSYNKDIVDLSL